MSDSTQRLQTALKNHGYSVTKPRVAVFKALENHEPQTMAEIITHLPSIDRASVYRTIELFERLGVVERIQLGWKYKLELSDQFQAHHHHISCTNCGQVVALPEDHKLERTLYDLAKDHGFKPTNHQLEIQGLCPNCQ